MYIFLSNLSNLSKKNYDSLYSAYNHTTHTSINSSQTSQSFSKTLDIIQKLGAKIYRVDQNSFAQISQLTGKEKVKFLESHCNN